VLFRSKDHDDYGLLKNYDSLTDEEKIIHNRYFRDGGRIVFMFIINPLIFIINIILEIIIYFFIDLIIFFARKIIVRLGYDI
jgi:hypothetical protein